MIEINKFESIEVNFVLNLELIREKETSPSTFLWTNFVLI